MKPQNKQCWLIEIAAWTIVFIVLLSGCRTVNETLTEDKAQKDSVRVEYRERTVFIPDTVFMTIPPQTAERLTADSTSYLENEYAESNARINPDGSLFHDLKTKPQEKPIITDKQVVYKDTIIYRDRQMTVTNTKEVMKGLAWYEKAQIWGFYGLILVIVIYTAIKIIRTHILKIREK